MSGPHPSDVELFEYVEGELDEHAAASVQAHAETCPDCAAAIRAARRGRDALRSVPFLELPDATWRRALGGLGAQEANERSRRWTPGRIAAVLAPVAAVAAAVVAVVIVTGGDGRSDGDGSEAAPAATAAAQTAAADQAGGGAQESATAALEAAPAPVREVEGTPEEVVALLEAAGFQAEVVGGSVEVTGARAADVSRALEPRADGPVAVFVMP